MARPALSSQITWFGFFACDCICFLGDQVSRQVESLRELFRDDWQCVDVSLMRCGCDSQCGRTWLGSTSHLGDVTCVFFQCAVDPSASDCLRHGSQPFGLNNFQGIIRLQVVAFLDVFSSESRARSQVRLTPFLSESSILVCCEGTAVWFRPRCVDI